MTLEARLAENTAALNTMAGLLAKFLESGHALPATATVTAKVEAPKSKAEKPANTQPAPATATPAPTASAPAEPVAESRSELTFDADLKPVILKLIAAKGNTAAVEVLAKFGVAKATQLKPEQFADALAAFKAAL